VTGQTDKGTIKAAYIRAVAIIIVALIGLATTLINGYVQKQAGYEEGQRAAAVVNQNDAAVEYSRGYEAGKNEIESSLQSKLLDEYNNGFSAGKIEAESSMKNITKDVQPTPEQKLTPATIKLEDSTNIGNTLQKGDTYTDNYENVYGTCYYLGGECTFHTLLNMRYVKFKGTAYIKLGESADGIAKFNIEADGKIIYSSPEITKSTRPIELDIDIPDCNEFKIKVDNESWGRPTIHFGDCGFYK